MKENELPDGLSRVLGDIWMVQRECPGIYYVSTREEGSISSKEYYIVTESAFMLSDFVRRYGERIPDYPNLLLYWINQPDQARSGRQILEYEINRYRKREGLSSPADTSLIHLAAHGHELNPEYFGRFPVPMQAPRGGHVLRYHAMANGIYWLETENLDRMLAICCLECEELSDAALRASQLLPIDRELGIDQTMGYRFFFWEDSCVPVFELLSDHPEWSNSGLIDTAALMNALIQYHPAYVTSHNWQMQQGLLGPTAQLIVLSPASGTEFYQFPAMYHKVEM